VRRRHYPRRPPHSISNQISTGLPLARPAKWAFSVAGRFFELRHDPLVLSRMAGARADGAEAELVQDLAHSALVVGDAEALGDEVLQVDSAPAHDPMHRPIRAGLDQTSQLRLLVRGQAGRVALRPGVLQPIRAVCVEAVNPVAQRLAIHPADPRRLRPAHPVQHRGQRQQAPALVGVLGRRGEPPKLIG
jgi:hypothetical protein